ncbi:hypothetical protein BJV78DRAFT_1246733, partial [Lactifluus subvellereus]
MFPNSKTCRFSFISLFLTYCPRLCHAAYSRHPSPSTDRTARCVFASCAPRPPLTCSPDPRRRQRGHHLSMECSRTAVPQLWAGGQNRSARVAWWAYLSIVVAV